MASDPYRYFRGEARDLVDRLSQDVLGLERGTDQVGMIAGLLRLAHTLKGAARVVKQAEIGERAHAIEDALTPYRNQTRAVPSDAVEAVLNQLDAIRELIPAPPAEDRALERPVPTDQSREPALHAASTPQASGGEADELLDGVAETYALLGGLRDVARAAEHSRHLTELLAEQLGPLRGSGIGGSKANAAAFALVAELRRGIGGLGRQLHSTVDQMDRQLRQLHDSAEEFRLVAAATMFVTLERAARDAARATGKEVVFESVGARVRLDSQVLRVAQDALMQLVRNAVAHGIEPPRERPAAGKAPAGRVVVSVSRRGPRVVFACQDDGRGIDLDAVRRAAVRRGMPFDVVSRYNSGELIRLLLHGGISTSASVTEVAGRGVGLDVVREATEQFGGSITVRTEAGKGTVFELFMPLSLGALEVLKVEHANGVASIPLDGVRATLRVCAQDLIPAPSGMSVIHNKQAIPFVPLATLINGSREPVERSWSALVVAGTGGLAAIGVDHLLGTARVVIRPMPELAPADPLVAAVSLNATGDPELVLDADALTLAAQEGGHAGFAQTPPRQPVLIVDDSLTTRMLEQSILESAGYEVDMATSAEEGLEMARRKRYALFLVDVEMPGMDGFTFVEHVRADATLGDIPAVLVSSRSAPEDLQRGRAAGAYGYIVKSEFDQSQLLDMISPLIG
jgi:two-component system, chemotaxis family, sensor kinase CheA